MIGDRRFWGKGYGNDAVNTLVRYVFTETRLRRVYLHTLDWNQRACRPSPLIARSRVRL